MFIDPMGRLLATASDHESDLLTMDIDPAVVRETRELWGFFGARRPDSYASLTVPTAAAP
jgi:predicted amidohydrolase